MHIMYRINFSVSFDFRFMFYSQVHQHIIGWGNCERTIFWHFDPGRMKKYWRNHRKHVKNSFWNLMDFLSALCGSESN